MRMGRTMWCVAVAVAAIALSSVGKAQTVDVKFRYKPQATYVRVHFPGVFNGWGPNSSGTIQAGTPSQADSFEVSTGMWVKTIPLAFGTWQYKIYRQLSATPTDWSWISDPLNRIVVTSDQNSQFVVDSLVLFQICAYPYVLESTPSGNKFVTNTGVPRLSAGIFQPAGSPPPAILATLDGSPLPDPLNSYDTTSGILTYVPLVSIPDGNHVFKLVVNAGAQVRTDSVAFEVRARPVQIQTPSFITRKTTYVTAGVVLKGDGSGPDSSVLSAIVQVGGNSKQVPVLNGSFADTTLLSDGINIIHVSTPAGTDSVRVTRIVNHAPNAQAYAISGGSTILLTAAGSTDPDNQPLSNFRWLDDPVTPLGLNGATGVNVSIATPVAAGEYYYSLIATDPDGNADTTRNFFVRTADGSIQNPTIASNPSWVKKARVYFLFPKAMSPTGTLNAAAAHLQRIRDLGFNVIWMMPVMKNAFPINNGTGPGYNIIDFYNVAPEYGSDDDFRNFVAQAHALGIKVILDVTPNHSSRFHPWAANARALRQNSPYWNWYQHTIIPHNDNGLGQSLDADGFNYYSGFSNQLLNLNWTDVDMRSEMINVYKYWIQQFGIDGYRFDVYWGPHRRYGEAYMGKPVRDGLKHIKPDILLLAEDDGTGSGTESIYADYVSGGINGGVDAAYDFSLYFNQIRGFGFSAPAIDNLQSGIYNGGFSPGSNALFMRFMESQDEDRIVTFYSNSFALDPTTTFMRTMPMASVVFTVPGFPMIWNGQEVGWGYGITGAKEARNRSVIDWNYGGKTLLSPHYQKLATIRGEFPAFTTHKQDTNGDGQVNASDTPEFVRAGSSVDLVYAFMRPYLDQNGLTVVNFSGTDQSAQIDLTASFGLMFTEDIRPGNSYFLNNLYAGTHEVILGSSFHAVNVSLPPYGSAIYTVSTTPDTLKLQNPILSVGPTHDSPMTYGLEQNYPNPFNPTTVVSYQLSVVSVVKLVVYDILGRKVNTLANAVQSPGRYTVRFDGTSLSSGIYFCRLVAIPADGATVGGFREIRKMMLMK